MVSFYYKVGYVETNVPWYLPRFETVKDFLTILSKDEELSVFKILIGGQSLYDWNSWSVELYLEFDNWQANLDLVFLERMMSKIYKIGFENRLLVDVTFCGIHQYSDQYVSAKNRSFFFPNFNNSPFIKFDHVVKTVDGKSSETFISSSKNTIALTDYLVRYSNVNIKYNDTVISKNSLQKYIFKEALSIDFFISLSQTQFEQTKNNSDWGLNLNSNILLNAPVSGNPPNLGPQSGNFFQPPLPSNVYIGSTGGI